MGLNPAIVYIILSVIFSSVSFTKASIAGIDIGYNTYKVSHYSLTTKTVDIATNAQYERYRPSILAYKDGIFLFESFAVNEYQKNPSSGYPGIVSLIGSKYDSENAVKYRSLYGDLMTKDEATGDVKFMFQDSSKIYSLEELLALQLDNAVSTCDKAIASYKGIKTVITVPDIYGWNEKLVLKTAASLAPNIDLIGVVSNSESVAALIASTKTTKAIEGYLVLDLGQSSLCTSVFSLSPGESYELKKGVNRTGTDVTMLSSYCTKNFNIETIDLGLKDKFMDYIKYKDKDLHAYLTEHKDYLNSRVIHNISKKKHNLNAAESTVIKFDNPLNQLDYVSYTLEQKDMISIIMNHRKDIYSAIETALEKSGLPMEYLNYLILAGGGSDILAVRDIILKSIKDCSMNEEVDSYNFISALCRLNGNIILRSGLNARDIVALGAGRLSAIAIKPLRSRPVKFFYKYHDDIRISHNASENPVTIKFFDEDTIMPESEKTLIVDAKSDFDVEVFEINAETGVKTTLMSKRIHGFDQIKSPDNEVPENSTYRVTLTFSMSKGGEVVLLNNVIAHHLTTATEKLPKSGLGGKILNIFFNSKGDISSKDLASKDKDVVKNIVSHVEDEGNSDSDPLQYIVLAVSDSDGFSGYSVNKEQYDAYKQNIESIMEKKRTLEMEAKKRSDLEVLITRVINRDGDFKELFEDYLYKSEDDSLQEYAKKPTVMPINSANDSTAQSIINERKFELEKLIDVAYSRRAAFMALAELAKNVEKFKATLDPSYEESNLSTEELKSAANTLKEKVNETKDKLAALIEDIEGFSISRDARLKAKENGEIASKKFSSILKYYESALSEYTSVVREVSTKAEKDTKSNMEDAVKSNTNDPESGDVSSSAENGDTHGSAPSKVDKPQGITFEGVSQSMKAIDETSEPESPQNDTIPDSKSSTGQKSLEVVEEMAGEDI